MKSLLLIPSFLLSFLISSAQISGLSLEIEEAFCNGPNLLFVSQNLDISGTYTYTTINHSCGVDPINGTVEISQSTEPNEYEVSDLSFGVFGECYSIDPPSGTLRWKYENNILQFLGIDNYLDSYTLISATEDNGSWMFSYENSYGDMGEVRLTSTDSNRKLPPVNIVGAAPIEYMYLWSTGDTTSIISESTFGLYSVTVTDGDNNSEVLEFELESSFNVHPDFEMLSKFYVSANGDNWTNNDGWKEAITDSGSCNPCDGSWFGIVCNSEDRVRLIELNSNNLSGIIDPAIAELEQIENIRITNNANLAGTIPAELGNASQLAVLNLRGNALSGEIPNSLTELQELFILILSDNKLTGEIPENIVRLERLFILSLFGNQLTGVIPENIGDLQTVSTLELSANLLSGSIPESISTMQSLRTLSLISNNLTGNIPASLGSLKELRTLNLSYNLLEGNIPVELTDLDSVRNIRLGNNLLTGSIPDGFGSLPVIETLILRNNLLEGCYPTDLEDICAYGFTDVDSMFVFDSGNFSLNTEPGFNFSGNLKLAWEGDMQNACNGEDQIGAPCDDGATGTTGDIIADDCTCTGLSSTITTDGYNALLYPNPVEDVFYIEVSDNHNFSWEVIDGMGRQYMQGNSEGRNKLIIHCDDMPAGVYNLQLKFDSNDNSSSVKFLKL